MYVTQFISNFLLQIWCNTVPELLVLLGETENYISIK